MTRTTISPSDLAEKTQEVVDRVQHGETGDPDVRALHAYLADDISLGKAAELLGLSRFELQERFARLGISLRLGPATLEEARAEVEAALKFD